MKRGAGVIVPLIVVALIVAVLGVDRAIQQADEVVDVVPVAVLAQERVQRIGDLADRQDRAAIMMLLLAVLALSSPSSPSSPSSRHVIASESHSRPEQRLRRVTSSTCAARSASVRRPDLAHEVATGGEAAVDAERVRGGIVRDAREEDIERVRVGAAERIVPLLSPLTWSSPKPSGLSPELWPWPFIGPPHSLRQKPAPFGSLSQAIGGGEGGIGFRCRDVAEESVRLVLDARGEVEALRDLRPGGGASGREAPQARDSERIAQRVENGAIEGACPHVIRQDASVAEVADEEIASERSEAPGRLHDRPWRVQLAAGREPADEVALPVEDAHDAEPRSGLFLARSALLRVRDEELTQGRSRY